jgi:hypothetical protein
MADAHTDRSGTDGDDQDDSGSGPDKYVNHISDGDYHNVVMAGVVHDGVHVHGGGDRPSDLEDPVIASVQLRRGMDLAVDADPPRVMVPSGTVHVITLEARTTRAVVLHAARPVVVSRRLPRPACLPIYVGATVQPRRFITDFDAEQPRMQAEGVDFPFSISATDVEQFWFEPEARTHEISWHLELDWTCAGRHGTTVIDNNGEPFELYPLDALWDGREHSALHSGCDVRHVQGCPFLLLRKSGLPTSLWDSSSSPLAPYPAPASLDRPSAVDATTPPPSRTQDDPEDLRHRILALSAEIGASDPDLPVSWPEYRRAASLVRVLFAHPDFHRNHEPKALRTLLTNVLRYLYVTDQCQPGVIIGRNIHADWLKALGEDHPDTLAAAEGLAGCLVGLGKSQEARDLYADLLSQYERTLGKNHPTTLTTASNLGAALGGLRKYQEAREQFETVVQRSQRAPGPDDPNTLRAANNLAAVLRFLGDLDAAQARAEDTLTRYRRTLGNNHPETLHAIRTTATIQRSIGEIDRAEALETELRSHS